MAFTTCLVNSLTRYLDYSRTEWSLKKYNRTHHYLMNVRYWWSSLDSGADSLKKRCALDPAAACSALLCTARLQRPGHGCLYAKGSLQGSECGGRLRVAGGLCACVCALSESLFFFERRLAACSSTPSSTFLRPDEIR